MEIDAGSVRTFVFDSIFGGLLIILAIYHFALRTKVRFLEREIEFLRQKIKENSEVSKSIAEIHKNLLEYFKKIFAH